MNSDHCYHFACLHEGECVVENGNPTCKCPSGYRGAHCEIKGQYNLKLISKKLCLFIPWCIDIKYK